MSDSTATWCGACRACPARRHGCRPGLQPLWLPYRGRLANDQELASAVVRSGWSRPRWLRRLWVAQRRSSAGGHGLPCDVEQSTKPAPTAMDHQAAVDRRPLNGQGRPAALLGAAASKGNDVSPLTKLFAAKAVLGGFPRPILSAGRRGAVSQAGDVGYGSSARPSNRSRDHAITRSRDRRPPRWSCRNAPTSPRCGSRTAPWCRAQC